MMDDFETALVRLINGLLPISGSTEIISVLEGALARARAEAAGDEFPATLEGFAAARRGRADQINSCRDEAINRDFRNAAVEITINAFGKFYSTATFLETVKAVEAYLRGSE